MPARIDPDAIPGKDIDPDAIELNAGTVATIAGQVRDSGANVHRKWQGMAAVYSAPEAGTVLDLMSPVNSQATLVGDNLDVVSGALAAFAETVRPIKDALDQLRLDAQAFIDETNGGVSVREINPAWQSSQVSGSWNAYGAATDSDVEKYRTVTKEWHEVQEYVDRNNELISGVNAQQVALWEAERDCANKIRALYGADPLRSAQSEDDALGYGLDEIPEGTEMPWGAPVERTEGCGEATASFVFKDFLWEGIIVGGVWGTIQGLGTLTLGYNPATGEFFSGEAYGAAWGNLGLLAASGLMNSPVLAPLFWADQGMEAFGGGGFLPQEVRDFKAQADEAALNTGKALIAWDKWQDDPGTALGESVFNVGTALIPVGGAAVAGVKTASTAASVISKVAHFADMVDPASWALNGTMRLGGATIGSLDNLIGRLDLKPADVHLDTPQVYTAMDVESAMRALDEWGVDLDSVTARTDANGNAVLEFPGGAIEMPGDAFTAGLRGGDGGADAAIPAPVREPELVSAGGVRGETGPGPVNSIVDDAPVRTETGGSAGESTVIRDPETTTGGGSSGHGDGSGGGSDDVTLRGNNSEAVPHGDDGTSRGDAGETSTGSPASISPHDPRLGSTVRIGEVDLYVPRSVEIEFGDPPVAKHTHEDGTSSSIPLDTYIEMRDMGLHNPESDTLVLGRWIENSEESYISVAQRANAMYFDMGVDGFNYVTNTYKVPADDMFEFFNEPVLDKAIAEGKSIRFTHDPDARQNSFLWLEARYLESFDYMISPDGKGGWIASP